MSIRPAKELLNELRNVYRRDDGEPLDEDGFMARLPISRRSYFRWRDTEPEMYRNLMTMLRDAGWLSEDALAADGGEAELQEAQRAVGLKVQPKKQTRARGRRSQGEGP